MPRRLLIALLLAAVLLAGCVATPTPSPAPTPTPGPIGTTPTIPATPTPAATPTTRTTETNFSFAVLGDNRDGDAIYARLLDMVSKDDAAFLINTGDLTSRGTAEQFQDFRQLMSNFGKPFYPVPGNHDVPNDGTLTNYLRYSGAPAAHYSFDYGQVHFAMANSSLGDLDAKELAWLESDLAATKQPVRVIVLHHPPFDPLGGSHILSKGNAELMSLAEKYQVRYVLAGHIHEYAKEVRDGVTYLVAGGAGAPLYPLPENGGFYHYVHITVRGQETQDEVVKLP